MDFCVSDVFYLHILNTVLSVCRVADISRCRFVQVVFWGKHFHWPIDVNFSWGRGLRVFASDLLDEISSWGIIEQSLKFFWGHGGKFQVIKFPYGKEVGQEFSVSGA